MSKASWLSHLFSTFQSGHYRGACTHQSPIRDALSVSPSWVPQAARPGWGVCLLEGPRSNHSCDLHLFQNTQSCTTQVLISSVQNDEELLEPNPKTPSSRLDGVSRSVYSTLTAPMHSKEWGFRYFEWLFRKLKALFQGWEIWNGLLISEVI